MITVVNITPDGYGGLGNLEYWENETVRSVIRNIKIILSTQRGTVPMYRDFGVDMGAFLDYPVPEAEIRMIAPIREAIEEWEPRATVKNITFQHTTGVFGRTIPCVEVEINAD